jgi:hypothetical protein
MTGFRAVRPRHFIATLIVGLLALTWFDVQSATAAPRWSKPLAVAHTCPKGSATMPRAAQNARGDVLVAWSERYCAPFDDGRWRIVAVSRKAGHRFGRTRILHSGGRYWGQQLDVALDARGGATVAWAREPSHNTAPFPDTALLVATRRPGRRFGKPKLLDEHGGWFDLAVNSHGETVLTWAHFIPPNSRDRTGPLVAAIRPASATRFGAAQTLPGSADRVGSPTVAIGPDGASIASWARPNGCCIDLDATIRPPGGAFGAPTRVASTARYLGQAIALSDDSAGVVAWSTAPDTSSPGPPVPHVRGEVLASRWNGQAFSAPDTVVSTFDALSGPEVLLAQDGKLTVEWYQGYSRAGAGNSCGLPSRYATPASTEPSGTPTMISPPNGIQAAFASALDAGSRLIRTWFQATAVDYERYNNCYIRASRIAASIDGGPTIHGPEVRGPAEATFAGAVPAPLLVWTDRNRVLTSTLRDPR